MKTTCHSNLADLRQGDEEQYWRRMKSVGVLAEDIVAVGTNDPLLADLVAVYEKYRLFASPEEQIVAILQINEQIWKDRSVTERAIRKLGDAPVAPPSDDTHLYCVTLLFETGDAVKTFERNWAACVAIHTVERTWKWDGIVFTAEGVRLRAGAIARSKGLRWSTAELGRERQNQRVVDVRPGLDRAKRMGMGQELPLIGALHPKWARAMDGNKIPFVDAPDLEVRPNASAHESFSDAPYLYFGRDTGKVRLHAYGVGSRLSYCGSGVLGE